MKKFLVAITTMGMVFSSTSVFAQDLNEVSRTQIINLSSDLHSEVVEELKNDISANFTNDMGESVELPTTIIIEDMPQMARADQKSYQITVSASTMTEDNGLARKVESDTTDINKGDINATIELKMVWTDGSGTNNTINSLSGSVKDENGKLADVTNGWASYGSYGASSKFEYLRGVDNTFSKSINSVYAFPTAYYTASFSGGYSVDVRVTPTIFS